MKKNLLKLLTIGLLITPCIVNAAPTASASCSSSGSVTINNTITVTVSGSSSEAMWDTTMSYDSSKLQYVSGSPLHDISESFVTGITYTYTFKAVAEGSAYVKTSSAISDYDGQKAFPSSNCTINIVSASTESDSYVGGSGSGSTVTYSSDNNLARLSIEGVDLSPNFAKDVYVYKATVENKIDKINIVTKTYHSKATVSGDGEVSLEEGENTIKIVVKAENGATKSYTINITRKEKDPINVKINGKEYSILRNLNNIEIPKDFKETTIKIGKEEVAALINEKINYTLVVARDKAGDIYFYRYENGKYTLYNEIITGDVSLVVLEMKKIPSGYKKTSYKIGKQDITFYKLDGDNKLLIYGININTGKENYYTYDSSERTLQKFDINKYEKKYKDDENIKYIVIGESGIILFLIILVMLVNSSSKKLKKYIKLEKNMTDNNEVVEEKKIEEDIEETILDEEKDNKKSRKNKNKEEVVDEEIEDNDDYVDDDFLDLNKKAKKKRKKNKKVKDENVKEDTEETILDEEDDKKSKKK